MSGYSATTSRSRVVPVEMDTVWIPRSPRGGYGIILCHGSGTNTQFIDTTTQGASVRLAAYLASRGVPCIAGEFGGTQWGNDTVCAHLDTARNTLAAEVPRMDASKIFVLGISAGAALAARWSQTRPTQCAGVVGILPAFDVKYEYENIAAVRAAIEVSWGVTYPAALPATADLQANAALAADVPLLAAYSSVDTVVPPAPIEQYVAAVGGTGLVIDDVSGHTDTSMAKLDPATVYQFLVENGA